MRSTLYRARSSPPSEISLRQKSIRKLALAHFLKEQVAAGAAGKCVAWVEGVDAEAGAVFDGEFVRGEEADGFGAEVVVCCGLGAEGDLTIGEFWSIDGYGCIRRVERGV